MLAEKDVSDTHRREKNLSRKEQQLERFKAVGVAAYIQSGTNAVVPVPGIVYDFVMSHMQLHSGTSPS